MEWDDFTIPKTKVEDLGHAGVMLIRGRDGMTKYYEYGRYDPASLGRVRRVAIPNVRMNAEGRPTRASLAASLDAISRRSGQNGRISGAYVEIDGGYQKMLDEAQKRERLNTDAGREPYGLLSNSCLHFAAGVVEAGGVDVPMIIDPRPVGYLDRLRDDFRDLEYNPRTRRVTVEGIYDTSG